VVIQATAARIELERTAFVPETRTPLQALARVLAQAAQPLPLDEIEYRLAGLLSEQPARQQISGLLESNPAFVEAPADHWWLGRLRTVASA
jgi:hypothetical protein